jgi:hypothetical protein
MPPYRMAMRHHRRDIVYIHRLRAEMALGRPLPKGVEVHHADGSTDESAPLVICPNNAYHKLLHIRMRIKAAGGNPNTDSLCYHCGQAKRLSEFYRNRAKPLGVTSECKACHAVTSKASYARKRARAA